MVDKQKFSYTGQSAEVEWDGRLCIHYGECGRAQGDLFIGGRQPWCQPDLSTGQEIRDVVLRCPTGALSAQFSDGSRVEADDGENTASISQNGPVYIKGQLELEGLDDQSPGTQYRAALCRCGHSNNKPFCDNSHEKAGFRDSGAVGQSGPGFESKGGPLRIQPLINGPVMLMGSLQIMASAGRTAWSGEKAALCRCGHSSNKPFCDGSHVAAGFTAE